MWNLVLAQAQEAAQGTAPANTTDSGTTTAPGGMFNQLLFFMFAFLAIMYFLTIRPSQKREKERKQLLASLVKGDRVVTAGGVCGSIVGLSEKTVVLRVSDEPVVKMEFLRSAVSQVTSREGQAKE